MLSTKDWQTALETGRFVAAIDLAADYFDDPTIQLARYISRDLSPINHSGSTDRFLDALYVGQAMSTDPRQRARMVRDFERHALSAAYAGGIALSLPRKNSRDGTSHRANTSAKTSPTYGSRNDASPVPNKIDCRHDDIGSRAPQWLPFRKHAAAGQTAEWRRQILWSVE
jgi:hypothetical protein